jgi:hypothetical protein
MNMKKMNMKKTEMGIQNERPSAYPAPLRQISLKTDETQSLVPFAAEEATLHASKIWSERKTQSPLPQ